MFYDQIEHKKVSSKKSRKIVGYKRLKELNPGDIGDEVDEVRDPAVTVGKDFPATLVRTEAHNSVLDPTLVRRGVL